MIFPDEGTDRVKRLCFPRCLVPLFIIVLAGSIGLAGYWFTRYQGAVGKMPDLKANENLNNRQEAQIAAFAQRLGGAHRPG